MENKLPQNSLSNRIQRDNFDQIKKSSYGVFYNYVLQSKKDNKWYTGYTDDNSFSQISNGAAPKYPYEK